MWQRSLVRLALGGIGAAIVVSGCSSGSPTSNNSGGTGPDLTGTYNVFSLTQGTPPVTLTPPVVTGTITLAQTSANHGTYSVNLTINATVPPTNVVDNGTYIQKNVNGIDSIYQSSSGALGQAGGTYSFKDEPTPTPDTLTVDVFAQGIQTKTVWTK